VEVNAPTGAFQQQAVAPISFPVRLKKGDLVKGTYLTAAQVEKPGSVPACGGSALEPTATAGNLCVYRGQGLKGGLETQDKGAAFFELTDTVGENVATSGKVGPLGALAVFRSTANSPSFKEEIAEEPGIITEGAYLSAGGSWAVQEK
jgi:hypothetical protein